MMRRLPRTRSGMDGYDEGVTVYDCDYCGRIGEGSVSEYPIEEDAPCVGATLLLVRRAASAQDEAQIERRRYDDA